MNKLVLITHNFQNLFPEGVKGCDIKCLYKTFDKISRVLRKFVFALRLPFYDFLFGDWFKTAGKYSEIILFDTGNMNYIYRILKKKFPNIKIIVWYWNSTKQTVSPEKLIKQGADIWSFDYNDISKYGFKYNSQFYFKEKMIPPYEGYSKDVFYVGADKNRAEILSKLKSQFDKNNISYNINLVKGPNDTNDFGIEYKSPLKYGDVIKNVIESKAVIDLVAYNQGGITLRPLEALFYKKKLITNMKGIVKYNFYNKNNIFILGVDDIERIGDFINSEYDDSNWMELTEFYEFSHWVERFDAE